MCPLANNFGKERKFCLKTNFAREKLELEQAVEELRQIFINGETGLKGKLKKILYICFLTKTLLDIQNNRHKDIIETNLEKAEEMVKMRKDVEEREKR
jgi:hypothetical protein